MPRSFRRENIALYAMLTSLTAISIDAVLPGLRLIDADFTSTTSLTPPHIITFFILGMVFGELLLGPMSDAMGRKKALLIGLIVYGIGTVTALTATSLEILILGRFLQGVGVSGPKIATRAMIRDQFDGDAMARFMSLMFTLFIFVPMLAPALGQIIITTTGWRGLFAFYFAMAAVLAIWLMLRQPETLPPARRVPFRPRSLLHNAGRILARRRVSLLILSTGFVFGAHLLYLSTAAELFFDAYQVTTLFPLYFAVLAGGIGLASLLNAHLVQRIGAARMARCAFVLMALSGLTLLAASAFWSGTPPLSLFMTFGFGTFFAIGLLFGNLSALAMRPLGELAGLGASLLASGSSLIAALFAMGFTTFYDGNVTYLAAGFCLSGITALILSELALRGDPSDVTAIR